MVKLNNKKNENNQLSPIDFAFASGNYAQVRRIGAQSEGLSQNEKMHLQQILKKTKNDKTVIWVGILSGLFLVLATLITTN